MNVTTQVSISRALAAIDAGDFDDFTVKSLLIDIRSQVSGDSIIAEVAHFVAHPHERDRGLNHRNVKLMIEELRGHLLFKHKFVVKPTFSGDELLSELQHILSRLGFGDELSAIDRRATELVICMLVLMQGASLRYLKIGVTSYLSRTGPDNTLGLIGEFAVSDLGVPNLDRPYVSIALPLVSTQIPAPPALMRGVDQRKMRISLYRVHRDRATGQLELIDLDETPFDGTLSTSRDST